MDSIFTAVVIGIVGTLLAAFWTFVVGFAGAPGAIYAGIRTPEAEQEGRISSALGFALTVLGQLFAMLVFTVFVVESTRSLVAGLDGFFVWLPWMAAWLVAAAPGGMALKDASYKSRQTIQDVAVAFSSVLAILGFFLFAFLPQSVLWGFGWVPHF